MARSKIEDEFVRKVEGPFAVVRACRICGHQEIVQKNKFGVGRGYGFREGNKARGRIIKHVKEKHAAIVKRWLATAIALVVFFTIAACDFDLLGGDPIPDYPDVFDVIDTGTVVQPYAASRIVTVETDSGPVVDATYDGKTDLQRGDAVVLLLIFEGDQTTGEFKLTGAEFDSLLE